MNKMNYRSKVFLALLVLMLFWFTIFYPKIMPYMIEQHVYPLLAVIIYESLFFATLYLLTIFLIGHVHKHSLKFALAIFLMYHVLDSVEPPFVLNPNGTWNTDGVSYLVSWDYGISYTLKNTFNVAQANLFYVTNLGAIIVMIGLTFLLLKREQTIGKLMHRVLE